MAPLLPWVSNPMASAEANLHLHLAHIEANVPCELNKWCPLLRDSTWTPTGDSAEAAATEVVQMFDGSYITVPLPTAQPEEPGQLTDDQKNRWFHKLEHERAGLPWCMDGILPCNLVEPWDPAALASFEANGATSLTSLNALNGPIDPSLLNESITYTSHLSPHDPWKHEQLSPEQRNDWFHQLEHEKAGVPWCLHGTLPCRLANPSIPPTTFEDCQNAALQMAASAASSPTLSGSPTQENPYLYPNFPEAQ